MLAATLSLILLTLPAADAAHVRDILATKCGQCHGPNLARPKGHFGFITDLERLAADPNYVVPGDPEASYLWTQIDEGEMPPEKAKAGPLTDQEKQAIKEWIRAGAPPALTGDPTTRAPDSAPPTSDVEPSARSQADRAPRPFIQRAGELLGKFHILTLHFPIALLACAALGETWSLLRRERAPMAAVRFCLWLGAAAAVVTAGLGWLHAYYMIDEPEKLLMIHRWLGTGAGAAAPLVAWSSERDSRRGVRSPGVRCAIIALAGLAGAAGHFGGLLVYGAGFFNF